jgi:hypothetical protein
MCICSPGLHSTAQHKQHSQNAAKIVSWLQLTPEHRYKVVDSHTNMKSTKLTALPADQLQPLTRWAEAVA